MRWQGAIIAQVAITSLSLEAMRQVHWTATAFLVASLIFGAISVYVSFVVQEELNAFHNAASFKVWLSEAPRQQHEQPLPAQPDTPQTQNSSTLVAIILVTPSGLLSLSLNSFVIGFGIYLGCLYTGDFAEGYGKTGSLGVLIFYLVSAFTATFLNTYPRTLKGWTT